MAAKKFWNSLKAYFSGLILSTLDSLSILSFSRIHLYPLHSFSGGLSWIGFNIPLGDLAYGMAGQGKKILKETGNTNQTTS